jgi:transcriptional regulator with GAF, ATPase, and Fis domain
MPFLKITSRQDGAEKIVQIFKKVTTIGSSPENDIVISGKGVEGNHAGLFFDGGNYTLQSARPGNEIIVEGKPVRRRKVEDGTAFQLGNFTLVFHEMMPRPQAQTAAVDAELVTYRRMFDLSSKLLHEYRLQPLLENVMDSVIEISGADKGFLILIEGGGLNVKVARNVRKENIANAIEKVSDSIIGRVLNNRQPLIVSDALHDVEFNSSESVINLKLCSVMCVPLLHQDEIFGIIYVGNDSVRSLFDEKSLRTLIIFSSQTALILHAAMRLDSAETTAKTLTEQIEQMQFGEVVGSAPVMQEVFRKVAKVAPTDVTVLMEGEPGTGKELIAREIHRRSQRAACPFISINCAAIPAELLESELFGHVKGAFEGAATTRHGKFQQANRGTLLIEEIGDMPGPLQAKLLRAIKERSVTKVGDTHNEHVDARIVATTSTNLDESAALGRFNPALYEQLGVVRIALPPLRDRADDILMLARYLLQRYSREYKSPARGFTPSAMEAMKRYRWSGNIREMENKLKKAVILSGRVNIDLDELDLRDLDAQPMLPLAQAREEFQMRYIREALARNNGNRTKTARELGVDPRTIFRYLERMPGDGEG